MCTFVLVKDVYNLILMCDEALAICIIASDFICDQEWESQMSGTDRSSTRMACSGCDIKVSQGDVGDSST
jgi:hypothetical protein